MTLKDLFAELGRMVSAGADMETPVVLDGKHGDAYAVRSVRLRRAKFEVGSSRVCQLHGPYDDETVPVITINDRRSE